MEHLNPPSATGTSRLEHSKIHEEEDEDLESAYHTNHDQQKDFHDSFELEEQRLQEASNPYRRQTDTYTPHSPVSTENASAIMFQQMYPSYQ